MERCLLKKDLTVKGFAKDHDVFGPRGGGKMSAHERSKRSKTAGFLIHELTSVVSLEWGSFVIHLFFRFLLTGFVLFCCSATHH